MPVLTLFKHTLADIKLEQEIETFIIDVGLCIILSLHVHIMYYTVKLYFPIKDLKSFTQW